MFRTRLPVAGGPKSPLPLDLHVLSLPLAFILSQDQTLHRILFELINQFFVLINVNLRLVFFLLYVKSITLSYLLSIQYVYERCLLFVASKP